MKGRRMLNENLIAVIIATLAVILAILDLDDGDIIKSVITAYLGFLIGQRTRNTVRKK